MYLFAHKRHLIIKFTFENEIKRLKSHSAFYGQYLDVITSWTIWGFFSPLYSLMLFYEIMKNYADFFCYRRKWHRDKMCDNYLSIFKKEKRGKKLTLNRDTSEIFNETPHLIILNLYHTKHCSSTWTHLWESLMVHDPTDGHGHGVGSWDHSTSEPGLKCQSALLCASHSGGNAGVHLVTSFLFCAHPNCTISSI